uniref:Uncharacterized protein n=1 Tax=Steinernema glaseri TaxID=37863 RepID=A0A1I8A4Y4_9BILA
MIKLKVDLPFQDRFQGYVSAERPDSYTLRVLCSPFLRLLPILCSATGRRSPPHAFDAERTVKTLSYDRDGCWSRRLARRRPGDSDNADLYCEHQFAWFKCRRLAANPASAAETPLEHDPPDRRSLTKNNVESTWTRRGLRGPPLAPGTKGGGIGTTFRLRPHVLLLLLLLRPKESRRHDEQPDTARDPADAGNPGKMRRRHRQGQCATFVRLLSQWRAKAIGGGRNKAENNILISGGEQCGVCRRAP